MLREMYRKIRRRYRIHKYMRMPASNYGKELEKIYKQMTGKNLNLADPQRYSEKIQWSKIYDSTLQKSKLSDKFEVRNFVKSRIGGANSDLWSL